MYNHGEMSRDFTYIDDLVNAMRLLIDAVPKKEQAFNEISDDLGGTSKVAPFRVINIGNSNPTNLADFINAIEKATGMKAVKKFHAYASGDVPATWADISSLKKLTGYSPRTELKDGVEKFVSWYRDYYVL